MRYAYNIFLILIIVCIGILPALADDIEWVDPQEKTLRLAESFFREGFLIEASDFYDNTALITVYDTDRRILTRNITRIDDYIVINDKLNITVKNLREISGNLSVGRGLNVTVDQWVKIQTRIAGRPAPKVSIIPYGKQINNKTIVSRVFLPGSEIFINFSIKNEGKAVLKNLTLKINSTLPLLQGEKLDYELLNLGAGNESETITVRFIAPFIKERSSFNISAEAKGNDVFGKAHRAADSTYIEVGPRIGIAFRKYVSEKVYMGDIAVVSISIENNGSQKIDNMSLTETLPAGLEPLDANLSWNFTLGPYEQKSIYYKIKPQKPGIYIFTPGSSRIEYQGRLEYCEKPAKLIVSGPYVVLIKSANIYDPVKGEDITITLEAKNIGDATAIIKLNDSVPADYTLSDVRLEKYKTILNTTVLHPGSSASFSYILKTNATGSFILPPVKATVLDQFLYQDERYAQRVSSNELAINVSEPIKLEIPTIKITPPKRTPETIEKPIAAPTPKPSAGFQGYIVLIFILLAMWAIRKQNSKR